MTSCVDERDHEMSISDEPMLDELDSRPDMGNAEVLTIAEFTSLRAEGVQECVCQM
jgi:hypothetical protein